MKSCRNGQSKILSPNEYTLLLDALPKKYAVLLRLCSLTGLRIGECLLLRVEDIREATLVIRRCNTKGKTSSRELPIPPEMETTLKNLGRNGDFIFESKIKPGTPITRQGVDYIFRSTCKELGICGFSTHSARRFFIHTLHHKNVPLKVIQKCVGHISLRSTSAYIDVEENHIQSAVEQLWSLV